MSVQDLIHFYQSTCMIYVLYAISLALLIRVG